MCQRTSGTDPIDRADWHIATWLMLGPPSLRAHFFGHPSICRKSRLHERVMLGGYCPTMAGARSQGGSGQPRGRSRTVWREARKSAVYGAALLAVYAMLLALYLRCLPGLSVSWEDGTCGESWRYPCSLGWAVVGRGVLVRLEQLFLQEEPCLLIQIEGCWEQEGLYWKRLKPLHC